MMKDYVRAATLYGREMFIPLTHPAGRAQADFGEALAIVASAEQEAYYFAMALPHSNDYFGRAFPAQTTGAFLKGHVRAFTNFGGVPTSILCDNTKLPTKAFDHALGIVECFTEPGFAMKPVLRRKEHWTVHLLSLQAQL